jgi:hypothetical protein
VCAPGRSWDQFDGAFPGATVSLLFSAAGPTVVKPTAVRAREHAPRAERARVTANRELLRF